MRVALWAAGSLNNIGDKLITSVSEVELERRIPNIAIEQFCPWARGTHPRLLSIQANGQWTGTGEFDVVIVAGGGVLAGPEFRDPVMKCFVFGERPHRFESGVLAISHGVGMQDGFSISKQCSAERSEFLHNVGRRIDYVAVRDKRTRAAVSRFAKSPRLVPDPVFAMSAIPAKPSERGRIAVAVGRPDLPAEMLARLCTTSTGDALREAQGWPSGERGSEKATRYFFALAMALQHLSAVVGLDFVCVDNMYGDAEYGAQLAGLIPDAAIRHVNCDAAPGAIPLQQLFAEYPLVLCSRFHSVVLALAAGADVIAIDPFHESTGEDTKLRSLMGSLGLESQYWNGHAALDGSANLADMVASLLKRGNQAERIYRTQHEAAQRSFDELARFLVSNVAGTHSTYS